MRIIDISGPIYSGMWQYCPSYPGAAISECEKPAFIPDDVECYCQKFEIGGQTGTYIETKAHLDSTATPVVDVPLDDLLFDAVIVRLEDKGPLERIALAELKASAPKIRKGDAVLVRSGWDRHWRAPHFVDESPHLSCEAAEWLLDRGIVLLGSDFPRFDNVDVPEFPWDRFFDRARFVLAPIVNLDAVTQDRVKLAAFPIKVEGAVSAPCRAAIFEAWPGMDGVRGS